MSHLKKLTIGIGLKRCRIMFIQKYSSLTKFDGIVFCFFESVINLVEYFVLKKYTSQMHSDFSVIV